MNKRRTVFDVGIITLVSVMCIKSAGVSSTTATSSVILARGDEDLTFWPL